MKDNPIHLDENELIWAVIAEDELRFGVRKHLSACPVCQKKKQQFEKELDRLGFMSENYAPMPRKKIPIISQEKSRVWLFRPVAAGFAAVILLTVGVFWEPLFKGSQENQLADLIHEMEQDQQLMTEIRALEENLLPDFYMDISVESYGYMNDEFMEFVVPVEETRNREGPFGLLGRSLSAA